MADDIDKDRFGRLYFDTFFEWCIDRKLLENHHGGDGATFKQNLKKFKNLETVGGISKYVIICRSKDVDLSISKELNDR